MTFREAADRESGLCYNIGVQAVSYTHPDVYKRQDYDSMVRVSKLIEQLSDSGVIVFVVSHGFEFIVRTCTEVVQLDDDGTIQNQQLSPTVLKSLSEKYFT